MSTLREIVYSAVTNDANIAAIISTRCYPDRLPEDVSFPAIVFSQVSEDDALYRDHDGFVTRAQARESFSAYADTGDAAANLADLLVELWSGAQDSCDVGMAQILNRIETVETAVNRHRHIVDVLIDYTRVTA